MYIKLAGFFILKGKVHSVTKFIFNSFEVLSERTGLPPLFLLSKFLRKLNTKIEVRKVKHKKTIRLIPFILKRTRQMFLIIHWLRRALKQMPGALNYAIKMEQEIYKVLFLKESFVLKQKKENEMLALINKSNAHFRW